jgi:hypothetical protein
MSKDSNVTNVDPSPELSTDQLIHWEEIRQALLRLRLLGDKLPPADAVATIREGRDLQQKGNQ